MNNKAFTISLVLAGLAAFMIYSYVTSKEEEYKSKYGTETAVIVAKKDIEELDQIHANMVEIVSKPKQFIEPNKTTSKEEVEGFIAAVPIKKGEQVTLNKIIPPGIKTGLSRQVSVGKRAIAIFVSDLNAAGRLIKPGDRIDIVATIDPPGGVKGGQITKIVMQDVPILAVGEWITTQAPRKSEKDPTSGKDFYRNLTIDRNFSTISIEVEPALATQIILLKQTGAQLDVMLRNNDDSERVAVSGTTLGDVLGSDLNRVPRLPAAQR